MSGALGLALLFSTPAAAASATSTASLLFSSLASRYEHVIPLRQQALARAPATASAKTAATQMLHPFARKTLKARQDKRREEKRST